MIQDVITAFVRQWGALLSWMWWGSNSLEMSFHTDIHAVLTCTFFDVFFVDCTLRWMISGQQLSRWFQTWVSFNLCLLAPSAEHSVLEAPYLYIILLCFTHRLDMIWWYFRFLLNLIDCFFNAFFSEDDWSKCLFFFSISIELQWWSNTSSKGWL